MNAPCLFLQRLGVEDLFLPSRQTMKSIATAVAARHGSSLEELRSPSRTAGVVVARHEAMALIRTHTRQSSTQIGRYFNRDHSTVLSAVKAHAKRLAAAMAVAAE